MEELAEGGIKGLLRLIRLILIEGVCEILLYWIGRVFLLLVTFGRYPRGDKVDEHEGRIILIGFVVSVITIIIISLIV